MRRAKCTTFSPCHRKFAQPGLFGNRRHHWAQFAQRPFAHSHVAVGLRSSVHPGATHRHSAGFEPRPTRPDRARLAMKGPFHLAGSPLDGVCTGEAPSQLFRARSEPGVRSQAGEHRAASMSADLHAASCGNLENLCGLIKRDSQRRALDQVAEWVVTRCPVSRRAGRVREPRRPTQRR